MTEDLYNMTINEAIRTAREEGVSFEEFIAACGLVLGGSTRRA